MPASPMLASPLRHLRARPVALALVAALALLAGGCASEEDRAMKKLAGVWARDESFGDGSGDIVARSRRELTLRADGRWVRKVVVDMKNTPTRTMADSGTYRVQGPNVVLRSLVEDSESALEKYVATADTLYGPSMAQTEAITGMKMGPEGFLVRER